MVLQETKTLAQSFADDLKKYKSLKGKLNILNPQNVYAKIYNLEEIDYQSKIRYRKRNKSLEEQYQEISNLLKDKMKYLFKMLNHKHMNFNILNKDEQEELINEGYEICLMNKYL